MKIPNRYITALIAAALVSILSGCNSVQTIDAPQTRMTVREARKSLVESLNYLKEDDLLWTKQLKFNRHMVCRLYDDGAGTTKKISTVFAEVGKLTIESTMDNALSGHNGWSRIMSNGEHFSFLGRYLYFYQGKGPTMFIDAILTLKAAALAPDTEEADFATFAADANRWLATNPKPEMPDEARTYKLLAEDAFKRKDFAAALDAYSDALAKFPMWPQGHYNAALLAAENEDYELAAHHMRRYLVLAPNAADARDAKDKLLLWQHKAKE